MSEYIPNYGSEPTHIVEAPQAVCRFRDIALELTQTYIAKNKDYGNSFGCSVEKYGLVAALTRISDKFNRVENLILSRGERHVKDESLTDTLGDMAAYCIMTIIEIENESKNQETPSRRGDAD